MKRQIKNRNNFLLLLLFICNWSCSNQEGYFSKMPNKYKTDSLSNFKELFDNLTANSGIYNKVSYLEINSDDCNLIPFCGYLHLYGDTLFYSSKKNLKGIPFLFLNANKFESWEIYYSNTRVDNVKYLGKIFDKVANDSLNLFCLNPIKTNQPNDASYLKYIVTEKNGLFKYFTFSGSEGICTIILDEYPKVVFSSWR